MSTGVQHSLIQPPSFFLSFYPAWVWLQGASAAPLRSSVMLSQSELFIKVLIQLHWCFHSETKKKKKKKESKGTRHAQSHCTSWHQIGVVLVKSSLHTWVITVNESASAVAVNCFQNRNYISVNFCIFSVWSVICLALCLCSCCEGVAARWKGFLPW